MRRINFEKAAEEIVAAGQRLYSGGLVAGNDGNLSIRISENEVLLTPTGLSKGELAADKLVLVNMRGEQTAGSLLPTSEMFMHLAVYANNPGLRAVVHAHAPHATAFALAGRTLAGCRLAEVTECLGKIPLLPFAPPGSRELAEQAGRAAVEYNGALLAEHGPVFWGEDMRRAMYRLEEMELACKIVLLAQRL